jgi:hypothetical protein
MRVHWRSSLMEFVIIAMGCFALTGSAGATQIVNGDFTAPGGLTGWTVSVVGDANFPQPYVDGVGQPFVSAANSQATMIVDVNGSEVDLYQVFTMLTPASTLSFTLKGLNTNTAVIPDYFNASLFYASGANTGSSAVPTVAPGDAFYVLDLVPDGLNDPVHNQLASGVTQSLTNGGLPATISVDVSTLSAGPTANYEVFFRVGTGDGKQPESSVSLSNVLITGQSGPPAVPEPATGLLFIGLGLPLLARHAWIHRRRSHVTCQR